MTITASIIKDSQSLQKKRLSTLQLRYPKFIHGEFMTHRVFSRNASSSRAIPVERMIQDVIDDPAMPVFWGKNRPGMQAVEEMSPEERQVAIDTWLFARAEAVAKARELHKLGLHKQLVNRVIEPWCHINVVVTSSDWNNFFALRCHPDAQPEIRVLADAVRDALAVSVPTVLQPGQWHLPYVDTQIQGDGAQTYLHPIGDIGSRFLELDDAIKISVARCARVSYLTHEGKTPDYDDDLKLYDRLVGSVPLHASPAEHQATPDIYAWSPNLETYLWVKPEEHGNFRGWRQFRKSLPNENVP